MLQPGKLENAKQEMLRMNINVMGISETRWAGNNDFFSDGFRIIKSNGEESQRGVAIILDPRAARTVDKIRYEGDRLLLVKLRGSPTDIVIIQVYMPTTEHKEEEVDQMYERIDEILDTETKGKDYTMIMGDWNAIVGEGKDSKYVGHYGLGIRNQRGEKLVEFCKRREMSIANTWFCQEKCRRYTWIKPGDTGRYQID